MEKGIVRKKFRFYGRVQGVGFRFLAKNIANSLGISGWVENKTDGSVAMEAQGSELQLNKMLIALNKGVFISIDRIESAYIEPLERERDFYVMQDW